MLGDLGALSFKNDELGQATGFHILGQNSTVVNDAGETVDLPSAFYDVIISSYQEQHTDASIISNVLADTYCAFSTGAMPLQVSMSGFLRMTRQNDDRLDFYELYNSYFRGTRMARQKLYLRFFLKRAQMHLYITQLVMAISSQMSDAAQFSLSGIGAVYWVMQTITGEK